MPLTSTVLLDLPDSIQSITYFSSGTQVDQITFSANTITLASTTSFNLNKDDLLLYINNLNLYLNLLITNFPAIQNYRAMTLPVSSFEIQLVSSPIEHIYYTQTSLGNSVYNINYVPIASSCSFSSRSSVVITPQEFILCCAELNFYALQISAN